MALNQRAAKDAANLRITKSAKSYQAALFCTEVHGNDLMCVHVQLLYS